MRDRSRDMRRSSGETRNDENVFEEPLDLSEQKRKCRQARDAEGCLSTPRRCGRSRLKNAKHIF